MPGPIKPILDDISEPFVPATLESSQRLSELALESGKLGSWSLNVATQRAQRSLRHDAIFGYDKLVADWTYSTFLEHIDVRDRDYVDSSYRRALEASQDWEFEARIHLVDGQERWIWAKGKHFRDEAGTVIEIIGLVADVTERRRTELALYKSEQLAVVGRLASTIAHEINNPLEAVTNLLYLASTAESFEEARQYLKTAESELQRVVSIANQTLRFQRSKSIVGVSSPEMLFGGIRAMFAGRLINHGIAFEVQHHTEKTILCYANEIRQVLTNLVGNAVDAMSGGGTLFIRTRFGHDQKAVAGVIITIADTGSGMSPEVLKKIYDPFFSTKGAEGSGLGLWISSEIVRRHHGHLAVKSSRSATTHGTVFRMFLPTDIKPDEQRVA